MTTYVALLRAVNLGPTRRLPMASVVETLAAAGLDGLDTYLATGNVRLEAPDGRPAARVRDEVAAALSATAGFDVPVVLLGTDELRAVSAEVRALGEGPAGRARKRHVAFLPEPPGEEAREELRTWTRRHPGEGAHVGDRHLHWWLDGSTTDAVIFKPATLKRLGIPGATSRTTTVVDTLVQRWC